MRVRLVSQDVQEAVSVQVRQDSEQRERVMLTSLMPHDPSHDSSAETISTKREFDECVRVELKVVTYSL
jgi:hypothetical protein